MLLSNGLDIIIHIRLDASCPIGEICFFLGHRNGMAKDWCACNVFFGRNESGETEGSAYHGAIKDKKDRIFLTMSTIYFWKETKRERDFKDAKKRQMKSERWHNQYRKGDYGCQDGIRVAGSPCHAYCSASSICLNKSPTGTSNIRLSRSRISNRMLEVWLLMMLLKFR